MLQETRPNILHNGTPRNMLGRAGSAEIELPAARSALHRMACEHGRQTVVQTPSHCNTLLPQQWRLELPTDIHRLDCTPNQALAPQTTSTTPTNPNNTCELQGQ